MAGAGDLMLKVQFTGTDRLSNLLDAIKGSAGRATKALIETNRTIRKQKDELRAVNKEMAAGTGDVAALTARQRALETSIAGANKQLLRQKEVVAINSRTARASAAGRDLVSSGMHGLFATATPPITRASWLALAPPACTCPPVRCSPTSSR